MKFTGYILTLTLLLFKSVHFVRSQRQGFDDPCGGLTGFSCNEQVGMACNPVTGRCDCEFIWMMYNIKERACQVSIGHKCDSDTALKCVEDASCVQRESQESQECACDEGFESIAARSCDGVRLDDGEDDSEFPRICCSKSSSED